MIREEIEVFIVFVSKIKFNVLFNLLVILKIVFVKGLFFGVIIGKIEGCLFIFNVVDGVNKEKFLRKCYIIISDDFDLD